MSLSRLGVVAAVGVAFVVSLALGAWATPLNKGLNVVLIVTDDQSLSSLPLEPDPEKPSAMPFLEAQLADPNGHWVRFPNAFISTPLCCPSRATILTGQYASETGVLRNLDGELFRDDATLATWLQARGYRTGLFGKYLNRYPFGGLPTVPPGWDVWLAKMHGDVNAVYYDYSLSRDGEEITMGHSPDEYLTDVLTDEATTFIDRSPVWKPFFLYYAPTAPHSPWVPARRYVTSFDEVDFPASPSVAEADVSDKPAWVSALPKISEGKFELLETWHRAEFETVRAADDGVAAIIEALREAKELDNTIIVFLSDNGYSYGEHRVVAKTCPYDECTRVPFAIRLPTASSHDALAVASNVDVASTIADAVSAEPTLPQAGVSLLPVVRGEEIDRDGVLLEWAGDASIPEYWGYRTERFLYLEYPRTGERELYDQRRDPYLMDSVNSDPGYRDIKRQMAEDLRAVAPEGVLDPVEDP